MGKFPTSTKSTLPNDDDLEAPIRGALPSAKEPKDGVALIAMALDKNTTTQEVANNNKEEEEEDNGGRPPLPPRPVPLSSGRPTLQSEATTQISSVDIQTLLFPDGSRGTFSTPATQTVSESFSGYNTPSRKVSRTGSEIDDSASLMSYAPTLRANGDLASLLDDGLNAQSPAWRLLNTQSDTVGPFETIGFEDNSLADFEHEFDEINAVDTNGGNEGTYLPTLL